jgi:hypothetical protein
MSTDDKKALAEYKKQWYLAHKERVQQQKRKWYLANRERVLAEQADRYHEISEHKQSMSRKYNKSTGALKKKIRRHRDEDEEKGRDNDITESYVIRLLAKQDSKCIHCAIKVKLVWTEAYDKAQFSINRIDNSLGHLRGNVEICCLQCNRVYKDK